MSLNVAVSNSYLPRTDPVLAQFGLGILLAALLPAVLFAFILNDGKIADIQVVTALACGGAICVGFLSFRKLHLFPGASSGSMVTSLTAAYAALAIVMLLLRFDYSRPQLVTSFVIAMTFFPVFQILIIDRQRLRLGLIPGGRTGTPPNVRHVHWEHLNALDADTGNLNAMVVDLRYDHGPEWSARIAEFALAGVPVYHCSDAYELLTGRVEVHHLSENTLGSLNPNALYLKVKSVLDRIGALVMLVALLPLLVVLAIAIKLDSPGPVVFTQSRIGQRARPFRIFKLRTMIPEHLMPPVTEAHRQSITEENDPRITRLGRILRRYRLDELPQLLNILLGDMSFIGPRPEAAPLTKWYEREIPFYHYRHIIKPGLTGWAQVNQGHVAEISDVRDKLYLDFYYVKYFSVWLDVMIILRTALIVLTGFGAK